MSKTEDRDRRLAEARILAGMLADRMMGAYVVAGRPSEYEIRALSAAALLLEERGVALPPFAEEVIARLMAEDEAEAAAPVPAPDAGRPNPLATLGRALRTLRPRAAA